MVKHNYVAIVVMVIGHMVIGFVWYGLLFADTWTQAAYGKSVEAMQQEGNSSPMPYIINIVGAACACFFISWLVQKLRLSTFQQGVELGIYASIGLVFPSIATHYVFLNISNTVLGIDLAMSMLVTILTCGVLAAWRKKTVGRSFQ